MKSILLSRDELLARGWKAGWVDSVLDSPDGSEPTSHWLNKNGSPLYDRQRVRIAEYRMGFQNVRPAAAEIVKWINDSRPTSSPLAAFDFHDLAETCIPQSSHTFRSLRLSHPIMGREPGTSQRERKLIEDCLSCLINSAFDVEVSDAAGIHKFFEKSSILALSVLGDQWASTVRVRPAERASYVSRSKGESSVKRFICALTLIHTGHVRGARGELLQVSDLLKMAPRLRFDSTSPSVLKKQFVDAGIKMDPVPSRRDGGWRKLCAGELRDVPGRDESWSVCVRRNRSDNWSLIIEGTDFTGAVVLKPRTETMTAQSLVGWALDPDKEIQDVGGILLEGGVECEQARSQLPLGPFASKLRELAVELGDSACISLIDQRLESNYSPAEGSQEVKILEVKGVAKIGVWIRTYRAVYEVLTNLGPAFMYPPLADGYAKLVFKVGQSTQPDILVKVPTELMPQLEALSGDLKMLNV